MSCLAVQPFKNHNRHSGTRFRIYYSGLTTQWIQKIFVKSNKTQYGVIKRTLNISFYDDLASSYPKKCFCHSGTIWLSRGFSERIYFLLRARFKKIISNIDHDSATICHRIAFGISFSYLKALSSPSCDCPGMTNQFPNVTREFCHQKVSQEIDHFEYTSVYKKKVEHNIFGLGKILSIHNFDSPNDVWLLRLGNKVKHSFYIWVSFCRAGKMAV